MNVLKIIFHGIFYKVVQQSKICFQNFKQHDSFERYIKNNLPIKCVTILNSNLARTNHT